MLLVRAYKAELDLNNAQVTACKKHAGAARWAYNWGLRRKQEAYEQTGKAPTAIDLHRELNVLKQTAVPWMYEVSKCAPQEALRNLDTAFSNFFRRCQQKTSGALRGKLGYPKPKSKKKGLGSFRLTGSIAVFPAAIQLPRVGRLRLKEHGYLPTSGVKMLSATVSEHGGIFAGSRYATPGFLIAFLLTAPCLFVLGMPLGLLGAVVGLLWYRKLHGRADSNSPHP